MIDEIGQAEIVHRSLKIGHAVLYRAAPVEETRVGRVVDRHVTAVGIGGRDDGPRPARDRVAEHTRYRQRPRPPDGIRKISEPFA